MTMTHPIEIPPKNRIEVVDVLRGIVMIIMALDHTRDFFTNAAFSPTDLSQTSIMLFFTRFITHFCAPIFIFLVGVSMSLYVASGRTIRQASWFLLTRGLWMIVVEITIIHIGWQFDFSFIHYTVAVITTIGISMIALSGLIFLPRTVILLLGLLVLFGHNALDGHAIWLGSLSWLHVPQTLTFAAFPELQIKILYPMIPWLVVPGLGYVFGSVFSLTPAVRAKYTLALGLTCVIGFIVLRYINYYGDAALWSVQPMSEFTVLSFFNVTKYPPSLLYLLLTWGVMFLLFFFLEPIHNKLTKIITVYGKVPFFYYVLHLFLIHSLAALMGYLHYGDIHLFFGVTFYKMAAYGYSLPIVYLMWIIVVASLYPLCKWYGGVKSRHRNNVWLSYL